MLLAISLAMLVPALEPNSLTPHERSQGWTLLFDGASTNGWLEVTGKPFPAQSWRIEDGCLRAFDPGNGFQDLRTVLEFDAAFEFQFEWKIAKQGNSGVKYLVQHTDEWTNANGRQARARGLEYQIFDDAAEPAHDRRKITASLYEAIAPSKAAARPLGEFNQSMIRVRGTHVEHWLNGEKMVEFETTSPEVRTMLQKAAAKEEGKALKTRSYLSLQNHGTPVWFRNLKVRRLNENGTGGPDPVP